jgi:Flp pilus assembly protein TadG
MRRERERGSITLFVVIFTLAALALASLIVDGGTVLNTEERAADIAQQAARAGADQINVNALDNGNVTVDSGKACPAADNIVQQYSVADNVDVTAHTCMARANVVTVTVSVTTKPIIELGFGSFTKMAKATASPVCGNAIQEGNC